MCIRDSDKPDTRFGLELVNLNHIVADVDFAVFKNALEAHGHVKGINVVAQAQEFSRKKIDNLTEIAKTYKAKGLAWLKVSEAGAVSYTHLAKQDNNQHGMSIAIDVYLWYT